jgi:peptidoglycan/LPS O-acetylase OafA/YrhL
MNEASVHRKSMVGMKYVPAIDGLRALAIGAVVASHFGADGVIPGGFGVTLFFFISGYLITTLMIREYAENGTISISSFYARRLLRLAPALMAMILAVSFTFFVLFGFVNGSQASAGIFYYMNYYVLWGGKADMPLGPLWSLAVEEHYYLLFPAIFLWLWKYKERFVASLVVAVIAVLFWRTLLILMWHVGQDRTYLATDTRIDSILYGAILAGMLNTSWTIVAKHFESWIALISASLMLLITFVYRNEVFRETARYSLQGIALLPLFYATLFSSRLALVRSILETGPFLWIGKLSYSLYLWHMPVLFFSQKLGFGGRTFLGLATTLLLAAVSYHWLERYFQRLRQRLRIEAVTSHSPTVAQ